VVVMSFPQRGRRDGDVLPSPSHSDGCRPGQIPKLVNTPAVDVSKCPPNFSPLLKQGRQRGQHPDSLK